VKATVFEETDSCYKSFKRILIAVFREPERRN